LSQPGWPTNSLPQITKTAIELLWREGHDAILQVSDPFLWCFELPIGQQSEHPTEEARRLVILFDYFAAIQALGQNRVTMIRSG
jgi:hypothetical protein